jgi:hypothetical protein
MRHNIDIVCLIEVLFHYMYGGIYKITETSARKPRTQDLPNSDQEWDFHVVLYLVSVIRREDNCSVHEGTFSYGQKLNVLIKNCDFAVKFPGLN